MTRYVDITRPITDGMDVWPGDPPVTVRARQADGAWISELRLGSHTGTHVDAPAHFLTGGATVDDLPLDVLMGEVLVSRAPEPASRLLLVDGSLDETEARRLVAGGMRLVGTDRPSIEAAERGHPVHRLLLAAGVVIVEGLDLSGVEPGTYQLVCLPLSVAGCDGAPARVILVAP